MIYRATAQQEGTAWLATVSNLEGAHTFAESPSQLDTAVREMIALIENLPEGAEESLNISWDISSDDGS